ncbi:beta-ketoacyl synthase chain length factor [Solimonas soli]|uniref:beta-ketoacyl synthase chain length factor n=1 Tax=Solimonas soli TaxID=413479 RepID=UPI0004AFA39E|nr:beta-ketoacyl synthase chain length factor [Solimonas soli]
MKVAIEAIGLATPGLPDWPSAARVLRGEQGYVASELTSYAPQRLPPNERRRATPAVRQAFRVAEEATAGRDAGALATVFAGSDADMGILHRICAGVAEPQKIVSPTDFHNSVHNAAAGYWGIAVGATAPSTTLAGYDGSFALALLEAALQTVVEGRDTLLVVFDVPAPEPLLAARPLGCAASCALWLKPDDGTAAPLGTLELALADAPQSTLADAALEGLRLANPALRALPLLRAIARGEAASLVLPNAGGRALRADWQP